MSIEKKETLNPSIDDRLSILQEKVTIPNLQRVEGFFANLPKEETNKLIFALGKELNEQDMIPNNLA